MKDPLYLIDAYGLIYRSYFAFLSRPLRNSRGQNVSALFGFARTLVSLLDEGAPGADEAGVLLAKPQKPRRLVVVFDSPTPTFRHKQYPEYKATRQKAPEDLHTQVPLVEEVLTALKVPALKADGFEADDIIATLAKQCRAEGRQCYILSSDKDLLQLVGDGTYQLRPAKAAKAGETSAPSNTVRGGLPYELVGPGEVKAEWGVNPTQVLDLLSLIGDTSDNVPGVKGVGEKTAVKLMARYSSLDEIYKNIAGIEGAVGKKLAEGKKSAYLAKSLITLSYEAPIPSQALDEFSVENLDRSAGAQVLLREDIRQIAAALDPAAKGKVGAPYAGSLANGMGGAGSASHTGDQAGGAGDRAGGDAPYTGDSASGPADGGNNFGGPAAYSASGPERSPVDPALLGDGVYKTILDFAEFEAILNKARQQGFIALDFETDSLDAWNARPIGISLALKPKEAFYVPVAAHRTVADDAGNPAPFLDPEKVRESLGQFLADPAMTAVAHNAKYDYKVSRGWGLPRWNCKIWDTMVAAWLDDPERNNYSLDSLASYHFGYTPVAYNTIVPKGETFDYVPLETATRYSAEDADLTLRVKAYIEGRLEKTGSQSLFRDLEMPLLPILAEMEGLGIKIEPKVLKDYGVELFQELNQIQADTYKLVGHEFNLGSPKQLQEVLFTERKLKPGKKTKTGYSTDVAVMEELAHEDPVPALILRHRTLAKLKSTYTDALIDLADREGRLHTNFVQTGTATGRLSSREPNLQNIPIRDEEGRRIREAFIAKPGNVLISADYSQIELVVLAHLSQDENLLAAFNEGKDVHARTAALIFGVSEKDVHPDQRRMAKTINFGVMYGMSAFRLARELNITRTDAANFIEAYFKTYAGIRRLIEELITNTEQTGYASTILGRRRYIPAINSRNKTEKAGAERVAVNTPIQGSAADIVKTAMLHLDERLTKEKSPAKLLLQVHDELILECPKADAAAAAKMVKEVMENAVKLRIPLRVSVETGKRWGDFH
ncbi:DNA-directed DNA polymerase [Treponema primitia ZAS-2]|uniref:DNA polymerase I n=1 Tax=Treponema primitia (strain ATCC BAA-887 / DSM 12427 / ZAS-2) TaxID=545694 RepID=F5YMP5_TREPZ|nr:DNA polymerase I [Treponema primitia]AEF86313.1 DNA-directed DNA polymerase [Treponema primitia ZAS-2]